MKKGLLFLISLLASTSARDRFRFRVAHVWRDWKSFAAQPSEFPVAD